MILAYRRLWQYVRPFRSRLPVILFFALVMAACANLLPVLLQLLMKDVAEKHDPEIARWIPYAFPAMYLTMGLARYIHLSRLIYLTELVVARVREDLLQQFMRLNLTFHNSFSAGSGGLITRVLGDCILLQQGMFHFVDLLREPITAVGLFSYMLYLNWRLTLIAIIFIPIFAVISRKIAKRLRRYGHLKNEATDTITSTIKESLDGVRVIQSFNLEPEIQARFEREIADYLHKRKVIIDSEEAVSPINEGIISFLFMGIVMYTIHEIFGGRMSSGDFVTFCGTAALMQMPIKKIQESIVRVQQTIVVIERLWQILDNDSRVPQTTNPVPFPNNWQSITFRNVSFRYGSEMVLKNISFTVKRGEVVALVGQSGSGKSTIVNLLERFYDPTEGEILIDNTPIHQFALRDLRRHVALVTQDVFLFRDSIAKNIQAGDFDKAALLGKLAPASVSAEAQASSPPITDPQVVEAARQANAEGFIENTEHGYQNPVGERGNFLSGGEKQRISIARAIYKNAPILILDEATSALDSVSELEVQKGLQELMHGRTAFVIAHRLSTIYGADRIFVLKQGRIVEEGTHDHLISLRGEYHGFFELQVNVAERG